MPAAQLPTDSDLAAFSQSVELAIAAAYDALMPRFAERVQPVVAAFRLHHLAHADELARAAGEIGRAAGTTSTAAPNAGILAALAPRIEAAGDEPTALQLVVALENQLTATHAFSLTTLEQPATVRTVATILPVEATHAAVAGGLLGTAVPDLFVNGSFESALVSDGADPRMGFSPFAYPAP